MERGAIAAVILAAHFFVLVPSFSASGGPPGRPSEPSTAIEVIILPSAPRASPRPPPPSPVAIRLSPAPRLIPSLEESSTVDGVAAKSAERSESIGPPFEQLIAEAKPEDAQGLHDFCSSSFPPNSRLPGEHGTVVLMVRVESDGHVSDMKLEESSGSARLDQVTQACVVSAFFEPHRAGLRAVGSWQRLHWTWDPTS